MNPIHRVLCPVDFSDSSRGALRYANTIVRCIDASLTVVVVNDPLLQEASHMVAGPSRLVEETVRETRRFVKQTLGAAAKGDIECEVASGKPAPEILRVARDREIDLIVMASHGSSGFRKLFFGSTTERVLRETTVPTLVTSGSDAGPVDLDELRRGIRRILVPVDLTTATSHQVTVARQISESLSMPLLLVHVLEPVRPLASHPVVPNVETERRYRAEAELEALTRDSAEGTSPESLIVYGEPAEEIAKVAEDRAVGLIVMGLHSSPLLGPRMGSVTYRVLCLAHRLVLALPPQTVPARQAAVIDATARVVPTST